MIDMHMHTLYSDGTKSVAEVLNMCAEKNLEYISITDHNTLKQYKDEAIQKSSFAGKIVKGVEMNAHFEDKKIEILAYAIKNASLIENWCETFFSKEVLMRQQEEEKQKLLAVCDRKGLVYDAAKLPQNIAPNDYITIYIYQELMRHKENYNILGEYAESLSVFIRKGLFNPKSDYFIDTDNRSKPHYKDVVDVIHQAGGLAFLAHPYVYGFENTVDFMDSLLNENKLDGIECFHPSADEYKMNLLEQYATAHGLYISGGSDYHGSKKTDIQIGVGKGNLCISKTFVEKWIDK